MSGAGKPASRRTETDVENQQATKPPLTNTGAPR